MEDTSSYVGWNDLLNTGIKKIDAEHRHIISSINALYEHTRDKKHQDLYTPNIRIVSHAIKVHLQSEEELLITSGFATAKEHLELHADMRQQQKKYSHFADVDALLAYYKYWWVNHIINEDKKYIEHLRAFYKYTDMKNSSSSS